MVEVKHLKQLTGEMLAFRLGYRPAPPLHAALNALRCHQIIISVSITVLINFSYYAHN